MAAHETTLNKKAKNGFTKAIENANNSPDQQENDSEHHQEDILTDNEVDEEPSAGFSGDNSVDEKATDSDHGSDHTYQRPIKPKKKGLKRSYSCSKAKKRKANTPPSSRKPKKRKKHFSSSSDSSTSSSDSSSTDSELSSSSAENKKSSNTWKMTKAEDLNSWKLPRKLAKSFTGNLQEHYADAELKDNILEDCPVSKNIPPTPHLNSTTETYLGEAKATFAIANDISLARVSGKIRDITGPLSRVWDMCHKGTMNKMKSKMVKEKLD